MSSKSQPTIYDISQKAGVSIATVSRVINESSNVNPRTREKILKIMEECGYMPNAFARGLGLNTMKTVGILCADSSDIYLAKAVYYIEQQLRKNGYNSLLCCTGYDIINKRKSMDLLLSKKVDSVILVGSNFLEENDALNEYIKNAASAVPIMLMNAFYDHENIYSVYCDDYETTYQATKNLIEKGRKKIAYLYNSNSFSGKKKLSGYKAAINDLTGEEDNSFFFSISSENIEEFTEKIIRLLIDKPEIDGIITSEDSLAVAAVKASISLNKSIPEDISIIGYNNSILAKSCFPELTSIDNKLEPICNRLVALLMDVLKGEKMPEKSEYKGELIFRKTT